jgi:hypothetical protein
MAQPTRIRIKPGIVPNGGSCPIHQNARMALTGTSKNTTVETMTGETRFKVKFIMVCPIICAPTIRAIKKSHSFDGNPQS